MSGPAKRSGQRPAGAPGRSTTRAPRRAAERGPARPSRRPAARARRRDAERGPRRTTGARATVIGLAHVAIAAREADPLAERLVAALGAVRGKEELLDGGALRVLFLHLGPVTFELLEPRSSGHAVARFLEKRGEGLHHVSLEVPDLAAALDRCRAAGVEVIDETPRPGAHGTSVAFLHPKGLGGVLVELCQSSDRPRRAGG